MTECVKCNFGWIIRRKREVCHFSERRSASTDIKPKGRVEIDQKCLPLEVERLNEKRTGSFTCLSHPSNFIFRGSGWLRGAYFKRISSLDHLLTSYVVLGYFSEPRSSCKNEDPYRASNHFWRIVWIRGVHLLDAVVGSSVLVSWMTSRDYLLFLLSVMLLYKNPESSLYISPSRSPHDVSMSSTHL